VYDPDYIPPCIQISGSERLLQMLVRLIEILDAKSEFMLRERTASERPLAEWAAREVANFWFAHAVNAAAAPLRHLLRTRAAHPERLYGDMARLAGALCTFSMDAHARDLPVYDHDDLAASLGGLERHILRHLEIIIPTNAVVVPLVPGEPLFHGAAIVDKRCFATGTHWYLGVRSSDSRGDVASNVPKLVKVCSGEHILRLVKESLPGLKLDYEPSPPSSIGPRLGSHYFRVSTAGPCWTLMSKTGSAGVYVPGAIPDAELELTIVLEE
jgi:type VI secretion system protein ImpJ